MTCTWLLHGRCCCLNKKKNQGHKMTAIVLISFDPAAWPEQRGGTVGAVSSAGTSPGNASSPAGPSQVLVVLVGLCIV